MNKEIPNDLISTKEAATLLGWKSSEAIRYYIKQKRIKGYKGKQNRVYVSQSEVITVLQKPKFIEIE